MALEDYLPNIFGGNNAQIAGLLGEEQAGQLSKQSNVAGLLGAAATLAQGMSPQGYRRSPLQNILTSLAAGYQNSNAGYQQGIQSLVQQQQLQGQMDKQKSYAAAAKKYPQYADLLRIDPDGAMKIIAQYEKDAPYMAALNGTQPSAMPSPAVTPPALQDNAVTPNASPTVLNQPTTADAETTVLPETKVTGNPIVQKLETQRADAMRRATIAQQFGRDSDAKNYISIADSLDKQIQKVNRSEVNPFSKLKVHPSLEPVRDMYSQSWDLESVDQKEAGQLMKELTEKSANLFKEEKDYNKDFNRILAYKYPGVRPENATPEMISAVDTVIEQRKQKHVPNTTVIVGNEFGKKRADQAVEGEAAAEKAMSVASDVRTITQLLEPYQGGRIDQFKSKLGEYLPGTSLAQLNTADDLARAITARIAPSLRVPGSGAQSDFELKQFMAAFPNLLQYKEGRELAAKYSEKFAERAVAAADIKSEMLQNGNYSIKRYQQALKDSKLDQVLTPADINVLRGAKPPAPGAYKPSQKAQSLLQKYDQGD